SLFTVADADEVTELPAFSKEALHSVGCEHAVGNFNVVAENGRELVSVSEPGRHPERTTRRRSYECGVAGAHARNRPGDRDFLDIDSRCFIDRGKSSHEVPLLYVQIRLKRREPDDVIVGESRNG